VTTAKRFSLTISALTLTAGLLAVEDGAAQAKPGDSHSDTGSAAKPRDLQNRDSQSNVGKAARSVEQSARGVANAAGDVADSAIPDPSDSADPESPLERARQGVVVLERQGKVLGVGTVLNGDGRIVTALSSLTHGNNIDARFADGSVSPVKLGHSDRGWDLALLIPQNSRWKKGLKPSKTSGNDAGLGLHSFSQVGKKAIAVSRTIVKGTNTLLGGDSTLLRDALELITRFKDQEVGAPIVDDKGNVVAVVARACAPTSSGGCDQVPYGVPVSALKAFLRTVPSNAVPPAPWLGIQGVAKDAGPVRGVHVLSVHPQSSAAAAGLQGDPNAASADIIVAVDGTSVTTPEALSQAINQHAVGESVQLLIYSRNKFRQVSLSLRAAPEDRASGRQLRKSSANGASERPGVPTPRPSKPSEVIPEPR
jgi:serine protease Do